MSTHTLRVFTRRTRATAILAATLLASTAWTLQAPPAAPVAPAHGAQPPAAPQTAPDTAPAGAPPAKAPAPPAPKARPKAPTIEPVALEGEKPAASTLFGKHLEATGGEAAWASRTSMRSTGAMRVPSVGIEAPMVVKGMDPAFVDVVIELPQAGTTRVGYDGTTAWSIDPMRGPMLLQPAEIADLTSRADFRRDAKLAKDAGKAEVVGPAKFNGHDVWQVRIAEAEGAGTVNLYDRQTGLLVGSTMVSRTQMGEIPVTVVMEDYKDFDGVKMPTRTVLWMMMQAQEIVVNAVEWNTLSAKDFALPPEIQALVKARDAAAPPAGTTAAPAGTGSGAPPASPASPAEGGAAPAGGGTTPPKGA
jgi:hypothetical protein